MPQGVFKPVLNMTEWGYKIRKHKLQNYRNHKLTQLISVYKEQTTFICCAGISKDHQKVDHFSSTWVKVIPLAERDRCK